MARITHPRPRPGRTTAFGIEFVDGVADVDLTSRGVLRQALVQHRYGIDEVPELEERTVAQLRDELAALGYDVKASWRKAELVERIAQHHTLNTEKVAEATGQPLEGVTLAADGTTHTSEL